MVNELVNKLLWRFLPKVSVIAALVIAGLPHAASWGQNAVASRYDRIVGSGDAASINGVTYAAFSKPVLNGLYTAFEANLSGAASTDDDQAIASWQIGTPAVPPAETDFLQEGSDVGGGATLSMNLSSANRQLSLNSLQNIGFNAALAGTGGMGDDTGIFLYGGIGYYDTLVKLAREGDSAPNGGTWQHFGTGILDVQFRGLNSLRHTVFQDVITDSPGAPNDDWRVFEVGPGLQAARAVEGQPAPIGGNYLSFSTYEMNDVGETVFAGSTQSSNIGNKIWFLDAAGTSTELITASVSGGTSTSAGSIKTISSGVPLINVPGDVVFTGWTSSGGAGSSDSFIFRSDKTGSPVSIILAEGSAAPDGNGVFDNITNTTARLNDRGHYVQQQFGIPSFASGLTLRATTGGATDNTGIFRVDLNGNVTQIFREGQAALSGNGRFGELGGSTQFAFNDAGAVAMLTTYAGTSGGNSDNAAIVISDGIDYFEIAREGVAVQGSTVASLDFANGVLGNDITTSGLNNYSQVAYVERLANNQQTIKVWTPELHYRGGSGYWYDGDEWTLSQTPYYVHDVFIDAAIESEVLTTSITAQARNLQIGGGAGTAALRLGHLDYVQVFDTLTLFDNGVVDLTQQASVSAGTLRGNGVVLGDARALVEVLEVLDVGMSIGRLEIRSRLFQHGSCTTLIELGGTGLGEYDQVFGLDPHEDDVSLNLAGDLVVSLYEGFQLAPGMEFTIFDVGGPVEGQFRDLAEGALVGNYGSQNLFITYSGGDGNDVVLYTAVPEPSTVILICLAILFLTTRHTLACAIVHQSTDTSTPAVG